MYNCNTETGALELRRIVAKKKEDYVPIPTPDRKLETPSGWCIDQLHKECVYQFSHGKCGCKCHKEKK
jgi:hypothetical protein